ncbi:MAG: response regulator [Treponema sp.]|jgi:CheY-like chemotaxis protein|nr:response regulator [Treponema sp.]
MAKSDSVLTPEKEKERYKIICVDDVQCSLVALKRRLMGHYEVYPAESNDVLFKLLEKITPDLILLDINMPGVDGYEVIKKLKDDERYADIPVIFLTSNKEKNSVFKGLNLGAVDYILKPVDTTNIVSCIDKHVMSSRDKKILPDSEDGSKPYILAVDDIAGTLKAIKFALYKDYTVYTIARPECVIDFLELKKVDLILLDYLMPIMNGFELLPMIRALPDYKNTPIIMLTSEGTLPQIKEAISLGATDFIVKPFKDNELMEKVTKHVNIEK